MIRMPLKSSAPMTTAPRIESTIKDSKESQMGESTADSPNQQKIAGGDRITAGLTNPDGGDNDLLTTMAPIRMTGLISQEEIAGSRILSQIPVASQSGRDGHQRQDDGRN